MKLLSVNVGLPREVDWKGTVVRTSIYKAPLSGRVRARTLNLEGDRQSDLSVHGGAQKAIYVYPAEHYAYWAQELPGMELPFGAFGENFTTEGLLESAVGIGDSFRVGSAEFVVTQPRMPCYKLGIRFGSMGFLKRFLKSGRTGFYLAVRREGDAAEGDSLEPLTEGEDHLAVADIVRLYGAESGDKALLRRASRASALPSDWRDYFLGRLEKEP